MPGEMAEPPPCSTASARTSTSRWNGATSSSCAPATWPGAADCAADGRYEFLLVAPALVVPGAVGSPVNPQAIK